MALHEFIHSLELGAGKRLIMLGSLMVISIFIGFLYYFLEFSGFHHMSSMDNAQLGRSLAEGRGFTTSVIRPNNLAQMRYHYETSLGRPATEVDVKQFPELSRAPLYPFALSVLYRTPLVQFDQEPGDILKRGYQPEFITIVFNQLIVAFSALLVLALSVRMFDWRVGWIAVIVYITSNLLWEFSLTAIPTNLTIMLVVALMLCLHEAISCDEMDQALPVWIYLPLSSVIMAMIIYTQFILLWLLIPYGIFLLVAFRYRMVPAILAVVLALGMVAPWGYYLYSVSGNPVGSNFQLLSSDRAEHGATEVEKNYQPDVGGKVRTILRKLVVGSSYALTHFYELSGSNLAVLLFVVSFIHPFKRRRVLLLRFLTLAMIVFTVIGNAMIDSKPETVSELNPFIPFVSVMTAFGAAMFLILLDRTGINLRLVRGIIIGIFLALCAAPMVLTLMPPHAPRVQYPPYHPPMLRYMEKAVNPEEVMMSDMPWATAWYTNRTSFLMPRNLEQFYAIHNEHTPIKALLLTPVTWKESLIDIDKGKLENWAVLIKREGIPENFPLDTPVALPPNEDEYLFFSDENRWQSR